MCEGNSGDSLRVTDRDRATVAVNVHGNDWVAVPEPVGHERDCDVGVRVGVCVPVGAVRLMDSATVQLRLALAVLTKVPVGVGVGVGVGIGVGVGVGKNEADPALNDEHFEVYDAEDEALGVAHGDAT